MTDLFELVSQTTNAMFGVDGLHRVTFWNQSCEELTGIPANDALGRPCHEVLQGRKPNGEPLCRTTCPVCQAVDDGRPPKPFSMRVQSRDGKNIQLNVGTMLIPSPDGESWMVVHCMRRGHSKALQVPQSRKGVAKGINGDSHHPRAGTPDAHSPCVLTERELQILRMLTRDLSTQAISQNLNISTATVRNHVQRLMAKLNVHSRLEAVNCLHRHHLA